jgi:hypothetical protein
VTGKLEQFRAGAGKNFLGPEGGWTPAFEGQRPPFPVGHELSMRHGAWSDRRVSPIAEEVLESVLDDPACEYLRAPRFAAELQAWSVAEARCRLLETYIVRLAEEAGADDGVGDLGDERVRAAWSLLNRFEARAMSGRDRLGLSPLSSARIGRDKAAAGMDMARLMAELHRRDQEQQAGNGEDIEDD